MNDNDRLLAALYHDNGQEIPNYKIYRMQPTEIKEIEVFEWLVNFAINSEWSTRNAAENRYCPWCSKENDYADQEKHENDCEYVKMVDMAKSLLRLKKALNVQ